MKHEFFKFLNQAIKRLVMKIQEILKWKCSSALVLFFFFFFLIDERLYKSTIKSATFRFAAF